MKVHRIVFSDGRYTKPSGAIAGHDKWRCSLDGELLGRFRSPLHDGARELLKRGIADPADMIETITAQGKPSMRGVVGECARWTMTETSNGPRRVPFNPGAFAWTEAAE
ncbi:MAG: hypothetical protein U1E28_22700 [Beijerinckiaceae bacterium]